MMKLKSALPYNKGFWFWPANSRKAHFYLEIGLSACGKWAHLGEVVKTSDRHDPHSSDDCQSCTSRVHAANEALDAEANKVGAHTITAANCRVSIGNDETLVCAKCNEENAS